MADVPQSTMSARALAPGDPLDYSFCDLVTVSDLADESPRGGKTLAMIEAEQEAKRQRDEERAKNATFVLETPKRTSVALPATVTATLKLNNNQLTSVADLDIVLPSIMATPLQLTMLDLSFNRLTTIEDVLLLFENLSVLYLHGNAIAGPLAATNKLVRLPKLRSLALHGNELDQHKNYRLHVIGVLPTLRTLDFTTITTRDRELATLRRQSRATSPRKSQD